MTFLCSSLVLTERLAYTSMFTAQ